ncbi:MAG: glycosyltransferase, partial [Deltaproteobacteria bacterium]|nr:glycosyltransferase [Deltaproteobacteria bacterium]
GLVWAARPTAPNEPIYVRGRSCDLIHLRPLSEITGGSLYGLQKGEAARQARLLIPDDIQITNLGEDFEDFSDTAAAIANLDLVISIDTSVAHLSGAMGKPTWLLLQSISDFRWLKDREDTPWYPTMRLFRQQRPGEWPGVLARVCSEIRSLLSRGSTIR